MGIGKRTNEAGTIGGGSNVQRTAEVEVEGREVVGGLGINVSGDLSVYTLDELIYIKRKLKEITDTSKLEGDNIGVEIVSRMCEAGEIKHLHPLGYVAELCTGKSEDRISELRLVEHGVSADVIAESREKGKSYEYVKITKVNDKGGSK